MNILILNRFNYGFLFSNFLLSKLNSLKNAKEIKQQKKQEYLKTSIFKINRINENEKVRVVLNVSILKNRKM